MRKVRDSILNIEGEPKRHTLELVPHKEFFFGNVAYSRHKRTLRDISGGQYREGSKFYDVLYACK